jgi:hypothetical protein
MGLRIICYNGQALFIRAEVKNIHIYFIALLVNLKIIQKTIYFFG